MKTPLCVLALIPFLAVGETEIETETPYKPKSDNENAHSTMQYRNAEGAFDEAVFMVDDKGMLFVLPQDGDRQPIPNVMDWVTDNVDADERNVAAGLLQQLVLQNRNEWNINLLYRNSVFRIALGMEGSPSTSPEDNGKYGLKYWTGEAEYAEYKTERERQSAATFLEFPELITSVKEGTGDNVGGIEYTVLGKKSPQHIGRAAFKVAHDSDTGKYSLYIGTAKVEGSEEWADGGGTAPDGKSVDVTGEGDEARLQMHGFEDATATERTIADEMEDEESSALFPYKAGDTIEWAKAGAAPIHYQPTDGKSVVSNETDGTLGLYGFSTAAGAPGYPSIPYCEGDSLLWQLLSDFFDGETIAADSQHKLGVSMYWLYKGMANRYFGNDSQGALGWHELPNVTTNTVVGDGVHIVTAYRPGVIGEKVVSLWSSNNWAGGVYGVTADGWALIPTNGVASSVDNVFIVTNGEGNVTLNGGEDTVCTTSMSEMLQGDSHAASHKILASVSAGEEDEPHPHWVPIGDALPFEPLTGMYASDGGALYAECEYYDDGNVESVTIGLNPVSTPDTHDYNFIDGVDAGEFTFGGFDVSDIEDEIKEHFQEESWDISVEHARTADIATFADHAEVANVCSNYINNVTNADHAAHAGTAQALQNGSAYVQLYSDGEIKGGGISSVKLLNGLSVLGAQGNKVDVDVRGSVYVEARDITSLGDPAIHAGGAVKASKLATDFSLYFLGAGQTNKLSAIGSDLQFNGKSLLAENGLHLALEGGRVAVYNGSSRLGYLTLEQ